MLKQWARLFTAATTILLCSAGTGVWAEETDTKPQVALKTDLGTIVLQLFPREAPKTVANFLEQVKGDFYDGVIFHRVIPGFMVQTGGYTFDFQKKPTDAKVPNESQNGLKNVPGTVAMARTSDPDSASTQFFINLAHNDWLDATPDKAGYTVFGKVVEGMDVAAAIAEQKRGMYKQFPDAPNAPVRILKATVVSNKAEASETKP